MGLVAGIYPAADLVQSFLNAYIICEPRQIYIENLLQDGHWNDEYVSISNQFRKWIGANKGVETRNFLAGAGDEDSALVRAAAFLTASSSIIARQMGAELSRYRSSPFQSAPSFGGTFWWLALDKPGLLVQRIPGTPRHSEALDSTIRKYHDGLLVTPASLGEWSLKRIGARKGTENLLQARANEGTLHLAASPLSSAAKLRGESTERKPPDLPYAFRVTSIEPIGAEKAALLDVLRNAYDRGAAILVLPELRMPPELLAVAREFLANQVIEPRTRGLLLVAAGSWHIEEPDDKIYNRCTILDHEGVDIWTHDKLRKFQITAGNVRQAPEFYAEIGVKEGGGEEAIRMGTELQFYDSVIGRIAAAICIGFFSQRVEPLLQTSKADLFLVPAMTSSTRDVKDRATALVRSQHAFTLMANCGTVGNRAESRSFCQWPGTRNNVRQDDGAHPVLLIDLNDIELQMPD